MRDERVVELDGVLIAMGIAYLGGLWSLIAWLAL